MAINIFTVMVTGQSQKTTVCMWQVTGNIQTRVITGRTVTGNKNKRLLIQQPLFFLFFERFI